MPPKVIVATKEATQENIIAAITNYDYQQGTDTEFRNIGRGNVEALADIILDQKIFEDFQNLLTILQAPYMGDKKNIDDNPFALNANQQDAVSKYRNDILNYILNILLEDNNQLKEDLIQYFATFLKKHPLITLVHGLVTQLMTNYVTARITCDLSPTGENPSPEIQESWTKAWSAISTLNTKNNEQAKKIIATQEQLKTFFASLKELITKCTSTTDIRNYSNVLISLSERFKFDFSFEITAKKATLIEQFEAISGIAFSDGSTLAGGILPHYDQLLNGNLRLFYENLENPYSDLNQMTAVLNDFLTTQKTVQLDQSQAPSRSQSAAGTPVKATTLSRSVPLAAAAAASAGKQLSVSAPLPLSATKITITAAPIYGKQPAAAAPAVDPKGPESGIDTSRESTPTTATPSSGASSPAFLEAIESSVSDSIINALITGTYNQTDLTQLSRDDQKLLRQIPLDLSLIREFIEKFENFPKGTDDRPDDISLLTAEHIQTIKEYADKIRVDILGILLDKNGKLVEPLATFYAEAISNFSLAQVVDTLVAKVMTDWFIVNIWENKLSDNQHGYSAALARTQASEELEHTMLAYAPVVKQLKTIIITPGETLEKMRSTRERASRFFDALEEKVQSATITQKNISDYSFMLMRISRTTRGFIFITDVAQNRNALLTQFNSLKQRVLQTLDLNLVQINKKDQFLKELENPNSNLNKTITEINNALSEQKVISQEMIGPSPLTPTEVAHAPGPIEVPPDDDDEYAEGVRSSNPSSASASPAGTPRKATAQREFVSGPLSARSAELPAEAAGTSVGVTLANNPLITDSGNTRQVRAASPSRLSTSSTVTQAAADLRQKVKYNSRKKWALGVIGGILLVAAIAITVTAVVVLTHGVALAALPIVAKPIVAAITSSVVSNTTGAIAITYGSIVGTAAAGIGGAALLTAGVKPGLLTRMWKSAFGSNDKKSQTLATSQATAQQPSDQPQPTLLPAQIAGPSSNTQSIASSRRNSSTSNMLDPSALGTATQSNSAPPSAPAGAPAPSAPIAVPLSAAVNQAHATDTDTAGKSPGITPKSS